MNWINQVPLPILDVVGFGLAVAFILIPSGLWIIHQNLWKGIITFAGSFAVIFCGVKLLDAEPKTEYALACGFIAGVLYDLVRKRIVRVKL